MVVIRKQALHMMYAHIQSVAVGVGAQAFQKVIHQISMKLQVPNLEKLEVARVNSH
uniref:Uncharacterized protein n=1 Tax=Rhizophora mucronata TaxID=61149 RepID=A0A2P2KU45_RHIMU